MLYVLSFFMVVLFNILWCYLWGRESYISVYNGSLGKWVAALVWGYASWGVFWLIYGIFDIIN